MIFFKSPKLKTKKSLHNFKFSSFGETLKHIAIDTSCYRYPLVADTSCYRYPLVAIDTSCYRYPLVAIDTSYYRYPIVAIDTH